MLYTIPTKRGLGIELWGTYDDLDLLYSVISKYWNREEFMNKKEFATRDSLISGFSYEIRKAKDEVRLKRQYSHFSMEPAQYFGVKLSWVHVLFAIAALRYNMKYQQADKLDIATFLQLEYWLERSMETFDTTGAQILLPFLNGGIYPNNPAMYVFMRRINLEYAMIGGGKKAFRKLPELLMRSVYHNPQYLEYMGELEADAKRLGTDISNLELSDDDFDYEALKW